MAAGNTETSAARPAPYEKIVLAPVLDITAAAPLTSEMLAHRGKDVRVDASKVERVGGQCLQVLLSAAATWSHDGADFLLSAPSTPFAEALETAGLDMNHFSARNS
jgi:chemotaxis protein CheX